MAGHRDTRCFDLFGAQLAAFSRLQSELSELQRQRLAIANKTQRLAADRLDIELLDEQARHVLGLGRADEILIR